MSSDKHDFLTNVIFAITLQGTAQRGKLYAEEARIIERDGFRFALRAAMERFAVMYRKTVTDDQHFANIANLSETLSKGYPRALNNSRFRIGSAQKALNLYLKLLWCLDRIPTPPHCPFDAIVLSQVPGCKHVRWTQLDSIAEYEQIVASAKQAAAGYHLLNGSCTYIRRCKLLGA